MDQKRTKGRVILPPGDDSSVVFPAIPLDTAAPLPRQRRQRSARKKQRPSAGDAIYDGNDLL